MLSLWLSSHEIQTLVFPTTQPWLVGGCLCTDANHTLLLSAELGPAEWEAAHRLLPESHLPAFLLARSLRSSGLQSMTYAPLCCSSHPHSMWRLHGQGICPISHVSMESGHFLLCPQSPFCREQLYSTSLFGCKPLETPDFSWNASMWVSQEKHSLPWKTHQVTLPKE